MFDTVLNTALYLLIGQDVVYWSFCCLKAGIWRPITQRSLPFWYWLTQKFNHQSKSIINMTKHSGYEGEFCLKDWNLMYEADTQVPWNCSPSREGKLLTKISRWYNYSIRLEQIHFHEYFRLSGLSQRSDNGHLSTKLLSEQK